ncbi:hypothetical protein VIGAN_04142000, partial [Vigna angularis var. angularis]
QNHYPTKILAWLLVTLCRSQNGLPNLCAPCQTISSWMCFLLSSRPTNCVIYGVRRRMMKMQLKMTEKMMLMTYTEIFGAV